MIGIFPEPQELAAESRNRIRRAAEEIDAAAQRIPWLRVEIACTEQRLRELQQRYAKFNQNRGRRVGAAVLAMIAALGTFVFDFIFLAPLGDFVMNWAGVPGGLRVPIRAVSALIWTLTGYAIGAKLGAGGSRAAGRSATGRDHHVGGGFTELDTAIVCLGTALPDLRSACRDRLLGHCGAVVEPVLAG